VGKIAGADRVTAEASSRQAAGDSRGAGPRLGCGFALLNAGKQDLFLSYARRDDEAFVASLYRAGLRRTKSRTWIPSEKEFF